MEAAVNHRRKVQVYQFICDTARVKVTMGGYAKVTVKEKLDASVNMGSNISYMEIPKEVKHSASMGESIQVL